MVVLKVSMGTRTILNKAPAIEAKTVCELIKGTRRQPKVSFNGLVYPQLTLIGLGSLFRKLINEKPSQQ
jgi:hypothetical protein